LGETGVGEGVGVGVGSWVGVGVETGPAGGGAGLAGGMSRWAAHPAIPTAKHTQAATLSDFSP